MQKKQNTLTDKDILQATISRLKEKIRILEFEIISIKKSESYITILGISNWNIYFEKMKEKLNLELEYLRLEIKA